MKYRNLGNSGVQVSTLCLGGMTFGEPDASSMMHGAASPKEVAHQILDRAVDAGINFIDVADIYGNDGLSERVLGEWLTATDQRDNLVIATKFRFRSRPGANGSGASRYRIMRCVEDSLDRLRTDRIDLYQIHAQDLDVPEDEILRALDDLIRQGKVLYVGCSNYTAYRLMQSLWTSDSQHLTRFVSLQAQYNLVVRDLEREHLPLCQTQGLGLLPWSPLAGGFLSGKYMSAQTIPPGSRFETERFRQNLQRFDKPRNWAILQALEQVAAQLNAPVSAVALAWLLHQPAVSSVIFGARTLDQLQANLQAAVLELSHDQKQILDNASEFDVGYPYDFLARVSGGRW